MVYHLVVKKTVNEFSGKSLYVQRVKKWTKFVMITLSSHNGDFCREKFPDARPEPIVVTLIEVTMKNYLRKHIEVKTSLTKVDSYTYITVI